MVSNFETYLRVAVNQYGAYTYLLLFFLVFLEAASIITSFLPGDSLIFVTGTLASIKALNVSVTLGVLWGAVIVGDAINYCIGKLLGKKILSMKENRFFKKESIEKAHLFYEHHGRVAIIMGRFIPIVRSFIAFVAGLSSMNFYKFMVYASIGGILRICIFLFVGYFFGSLKIVRDNLEFAIMIVAAVTMLPAIIGFVRGKQNKTTP
ncbi:hypothetical protein GOM49_15760 [Clostridium bovifaecis]|uniref:VTT domain-containing protein n=1 Tax=Clostridium bovifaecis TaxID=2184719 RepID=A0A6I6F563_9CLOT|nr:hypothetical protein GOM49_15760 [Clostridium bovifaecis]